MRRGLGLILACVLAGCAGDDAAEIAAVRAATMAGPPIPWEELDIHPALAARPCLVTTLVSRTGSVLGYCRDGRQCRTMDWRPIEDGCRATRSAARN